MWYVLSRSRNWKRSCAQLYLVRTYQGHNKKKTSGKLGRKTKPTQAASVNTPRHCSEMFLYFLRLPASRQMEYLSRLSVCYEPKFVGIFLSSVSLRSEQPIRHDLMHNSNMHSVSKACKSSLSVYWQCPVRWKPLQLQCFGLNQMPPQRTLNTAG